MSERKVTFTVDGMALHGDLATPGPRAPGVALCHGLESSKDSRKWTVLAHELARAGLAALRFNFRGCGEGPEASDGIFEDSTLTSRVGDLQGALDTLAAHGADPDRLGVIGSSFGGMVAIAAAALRIKAQVLLATPAHLRELDHLRAPGEEFLPLPSGQRLRRTVLDDAARYDLPYLLGQRPRPTLIIHGDTDELVPLDHPRALYEAAQEPRSLEVIPGGSHTFDAPAHLERVVALAVDWMRTHL